MKSSLLALTAVAIVAATTVPGTAEARCRGCGVAAGVVGGLAAGAIIGSALAAPRYAEPVYEEVPPPPPRYYYEEDDDGPICRVERRRIWVEGFGWRRQRIEVCE